MKIAEAPNSEAEFGVGRGLIRSANFFLFLGLAFCSAAATASVGAQRQELPPDVKAEIEAHERWLETNGAEGQRADFTSGKLRGLNLTKRNLSDAVLVGADLAGAQMHLTELRGAILYKAILNEAYAVGADFTGAFLQEAHFTGTDLSSADLQHTVLTAANLNKAIMVGTKLKGADLSYADLTEATFIPQSIPEARLIANTKGLSTLVFRRKPSLGAAQESIAGILLRDAFKKSGFINQERQVTYALRHFEEILGEDDLFRWLFFEWTCNWGMTPRRPLMLLLRLTLLCAFVYMLALFLTAQEEPSTGIYRKWPESSGRAPEFLSRKNCSPVLVGFAFSVLSAFYFGWREFKFDWLARLNPHDYRLEATGRLKTVSAVQAILSTYLFALWILTYFGRPFE